MLPLNLSLSINSVNDERTEEHDIDANIEF